MLEVGGGAPQRRAPPPPPQAPSPRSPPPSVSKEGNQEASARLVWVISTCFIPAIKIINNISNYYTHTK